MKKVVGVTPRMKEVVGVKPENERDSFTQKSKVT